jgi:hypothetical protein
MANAPRDITKQIGGNGSKQPSDVASAINQVIGKNLDIASTKLPLQESGTTLPPISKIK